MIETYSQDIKLKRETPRPKRSDNQLNIKNVDKIMPIGNGGEPKTPLERGIDKEFLIKN